jgi:hypothetical protein
MMMLRRTGACIFHLKKAFLDSNCCCAAAGGGAPPPSVAGVIHWRLGVIHCRLGVIHYVSLCRILAQQRLKFGRRAIALTFGLLQNLVGGVRLVLVFSSLLIRLL